MTAFGVRCALARHHVNPLVAQLRSIGRLERRGMCTAEPLVEGNEVSETRRITASDLRMFGYLSGDYNPIHYQGIPSGDGKTNNVVVHGAYLNALVSGVIGTRLPGPGTVVVSQVLRFPRPCLVDEEVTTVVQVESVRKLVEVIFHCIVGDKTKEHKVVLIGSAKLIVPHLMSRNAKE